ncbi:unnamed protein product [Pleuronectes platessa]|uniref:Uncharacterized protein n=1 Tax=Pleuronectes platessa TaxID=8262 RepID=A0A9N7UHJ3_PLEPL|nr:unnamed protein product [Pleuronectes platessa]
MPAGDGEETQKRRPETYSLSSAALSESFVNHRPRGSEERGMKGGGGERRRRRRRVQAGTGDGGVNQYLRTRASKEGGGLTESRSSVCHRCEHHEKHFQETNTQQELINLSEKKKKAKRISCCVLICGSGHSSEFLPEGCLEKVLEKVWRTSGEPLENLWKMSTDEKRHGPWDKLSAVWARKPSPVPVLAHRISAERSTVTRSWL